MRPGRIMPTFPAALSFSTAGFASVRLEGWQAPVGGLIGRARFDHWVHGDGRRRSSPGFHTPLNVVPDGVVDRDRNWWLAPN